MKKQHGIRIGQRITVTHNGKSRSGTVKWIHPKRTFFAVEFVSNYWNQFKNGYDKYLECFHINKQERSVI